MLITRRWSQARCKVIPASGRPWQQSGVASQFFGSARSSPPPQHALTVPAALGGSLLPCPPAVPCDISCMGRCIWGLSVSTSSALTLCPAVRHLAGSRSWIFVRWSKSVYSTTRASPWCEAVQCSADTKDLSSLLGPAEDTGSSMGHVTTCTQGRAVSAGTGEALSGHLHKHEAVVKLPRAQP